MDIVLGIVLFLIGIAMLLPTTKYGALVWQKEAEESYIVAIIGTTGLFIVIAGLHLLGASWLLSLIISIILFRSFFSYFYTDKENSLINKIMSIGVDLLMIGLFIYVYYAAHISGVEEIIEKTINRK